MSRSVKKTPSFTNSGSNGRRFAKREANAKVRNTPDIPDGCTYRKVYCSYNICDYRSIYYTEAGYRRYIEKLWADFEEGVRWLRDRGSVESLAHRPKRK